ncbi:hypothetical protein GC207_10340 [bacterium]|nr:hypothetical protein [bacterium]
MKLCCLLFAAGLSLTTSSFALDGVVGIHDPSTILEYDGKYYTYGTGGSCLVSADGCTWQRGATPARRGMVPDGIHIGDRYYPYVARNVGAQPTAEIDMIWTKSLDPESPDYKWEEGGVVASSDSVAGDGKGTFSLDFVDAKESKQCGHKHEANET